MLSSTESIVRRWEKYFKNLLNRTNTHSEEEAELEDFGLGSPIKGVEVAGAIKQLHSGRALGMVELLNAPDVVGLSW